MYLFCFFSSGSSRIWVQFDDFDLHDQEKSKSSINDRVQPQNPRKKVKMKQPESNRILVLRGQKELTSWRILSKNISRMNNKKLHISKEYQTSNHNRLANETSNISSNHRVNSSDSLLHNSVYIKNRKIIENQIPRIETKRQSTIKWPLFYTTQHFQRDGKLFENLKYLPYEKNNQNNNNDGCSGSHLEVGVIFVIIYE